MSLAYARHHQLLRHLYYVQRHERALGSGNGHRLSPLHRARGREGAVRGQGHSVVPPARSVDASRCCPGTTTAACSKYCWTMATIETAVRRLWSLGYHRNGCRSVVATQNRDRQGRPHAHPRRSRDPHLRRGSCAARQGRSFARVLGRLAELLLAKAEAQRRVRPGCRWPASTQGRHWLGRSHTRTATDRWSRPPGPSHRSHCCCSRRGRPTRR